MDNLGLFGIFIVGFVGALTPGPDILFVLRTSLCTGARAAFAAFLGIASGWAIFLGTLYFGLSYVLGNAYVQTMLTFAGGVYLIYLAGLLLKNPVSAPTMTQAYSNQTNDGVRILLKTYVKALGINLSNPKAILFFATIIVPFMEVDLAARIVVLFCALSLPFLGVIALGSAIKNYLTPKVFVWIDRICGVIFMCFSVYLLFNAFVSVLGFL
ncbi:LysE family translocator [uncultured Helicobacter sp.]|uniref:LysE family translocator n=1 Tax=uncultured Helicobacter sp. TaxID=175537 RepID=UPI00374F2D77